MSTHKHIDRICAAITVFTLLLTILFMNGGALGIQSSWYAMGYEKRLFDSAVVHQIDIVMEGWDEFIETCENEEYSPCTVVIDGECCKNVGIRAKGNTSLSQVKQMNSERYSFKLEFDQYEKGKSYYGLDKLCLNNLIQDNTLMKDYLVYEMMADFGVDSPLCSFAYITVNGEDWGLYLAVEGVEDGFLQRNYGADAGELYKPDSLSFGGDRGAEQNFSMDNAFRFDKGAQGEEGHVGGISRIPDDGGLRQDGRGSDDVKLKYIDDAPDSYANIFDHAKTDVTGADKARLIAALKDLGEYTNLEQVLDTEEVLRYFVVHNFVCNGDSYTGSIIHNYYLHEADGKLSMIPWDYNLAFGTFEGNYASNAVNASIDNPVSGSSVDDRPMLGWIFSDQAYTERYHALFSEFLVRWFSGRELAEMIANTAALIRPYVEKDPTKFCTAEEFETGVTALSQFVSLRAEAVSRQLAGESAPVDTGRLSLSDMGTMDGGMRGGKENGGNMRPDVFADSKAYEGTNRTPGDFPTLPEGQDFGGGQSGTPPERLGDTVGEEAVQPPEMPENWRENGAQPDFVHENGDIENPPDSSGIQRPWNNGNMEDMPGQENLSQHNDGDSSLSMMPVLLLGVSVGIFVLGYVIACSFQRRG